MLAFTASRDLIPLYGLYSLYFADAGLGPAAISSLFVAWSLTAFVCEVPSGAWADTVDRRTLLIVSGLLYAVAFTSWMLVPSYPGFLTGFVLWGLSSAIASGTFEAWLYDELTAAGSVHEYARLIGWGHALAMLANLLATASSAVLYGWGGYALVGWVSVAVTVGHTALACWLPSAHVVESAQPDTRAATTARPTQPTQPSPRPASVWVVYRRMLAAGLREATAESRVRGAVVLSAVVLGFSAYDEYFGLVAQAHGADPRAAAWLVTIAVVGQVAGTALAGRTVGMGRRTFAAVVVLAGLAVSAGLWTGGVTGFAVLALGYGLLNNAMIVSGARLQETITGPARATVTSVSGLSSEVVALAVYGFVAVGAGPWGLITVVTLLGLPVVVAGLVAPLLLPARDPDVRTPGEGAP